MVKVTFFFIEFTMFFDLKSNFRETSTKKVNYTKHVLA